MNGDVLSDLERLLKSQAPSADGGYTTKMIEKATGKPADWVRTALREALRQGVWERCRVREENLSGHMMTKTAFRPVKSKSKKR